MAELYKKKGLAHSAAVVLFRALRSESEPSVHRVKDSK